VSIEVDRGWIAEFIFQRAILDNGSSARLRWSPAMIGMAALSAG
jgi:hypothetical protein